MVNPFPPAASGTTVRSRDSDDGPARGRWWGVGIIIVAIGVAAAFAVATNSGDDVARAVVAEQARAAAGRPPEVTADGQRFPDLARSDGWSAVSGDTAEVLGRRVTTVTYERDGTRLSYSIIAGPPLGAPPDSRSVGGRPPVVMTFDAAGRLGAMVTRDGHSVIVSSAGVPRSALVRAARAGGAGG